MSKKVRLDTFLVEKGFLIQEKKQSVQLWLVWYFIIQNV